MDGDNKASIETQNESFYWSLSIGFHFQNDSEKDTTQYGYIYLN